MRPTSFPPGLGSPEVSDVGSSGQMWNSPNRASLLSKGVSIEEIPKVLLAMSVSACLKNIDCSSHPQPFAPCVQSKVTVTSWSIGDHRRNQPVMPLNLEQTYHHICVHSNPYQPYESTRKKQPITFCYNQALCQIMSNYLQPCKTPIVGQDRWLV